MVQIIKKTEHWDYFSSKMQKLITNGVLCDVTLISESKRFPVSRILLSACSDYFETMFTSQFKERDSAEVSLSEVNANDLYSLITFSFTGTLEINSENAETLLRSAHLLQFSTVVSICCEYIIGSLTPDNCLRFWLLAKHLMLQEFEQQIFQYGLHHFSKINISEYVQLNHNELDEFVRNSDLNIRAESVALDIIINWIQHEPSSRIENIKALATCVNFNIIKHSDFAKYIDFLRQFNEAHDFLIDMMKFYFSFLQENIEDSANSGRRCTAISLSAEGFEKYQKKLEKWVPCAPMVIDELKYNEVLAAHIDGNLLYTVSKHPGINISIELYDLKKKLFITRICTIPYESAAITLSYPIVYFVGPDKTIYGYNLARLEEHKLPDMLMHVERYLSGVAIFDRKLYLFGGCPGGSAEYISLLRRKKQQLAPMLCAVSDMGVAVLNKKIYIVGGRCLTCVTNHNPGTTPSGCTNKVQCYDPILNTWTCLGNFKTNCYSMKICISNGKVFASGFVQTYKDSRTNKKKVYVYNPSIDQWQVMDCLQNVSRCLFTGSTEHLIMKHDEV